MQWEWTEQAMKERLVSGEEVEFCDEKIRKEYNNLSEICVKSADVTFDKRISIDLGKITCTALYCPSPHSKDSVIIYVPEEKILKIPFEVYLHGHCEPLSREQVFIDLEEMMGDN